MDTIGHHRGTPAPHRLPGDGAPTSAPLRLVTGCAAAGAAVGSLGCALAAQALGVLAALPRPWDAPSGWTVAGAARVEDLVGLGAMLVGAGVAAWFCLGLLLAAACTGARAAGTAWVAGERLLDLAGPPLVRRALALSLGTGVALAGAGLPATAAATPPDDLGWVVTSSDPPPGPPPGHADGVLDATATGVPTATAAGSAAATATAAPTAAAAAAAEPTAGHDAATAGPDAPTAEVTAAAAVTVRPGDTLWDIARSHLPAGAPDAHVAATWPAWYAANVDVVGRDPDLIRPGQRLVPPTAAGASPAVGDAVDGAGPTAPAADRTDR